MREIHSNWKAVCSDCISIALITASACIGLKFLSFFDHWVFFPTWPNIADVVVLWTTEAWLIRHFLVAKLRCLRRIGVDIPGKDVDDLPPKQRIQV